MGLVGAAPPATALPTSNFEGRIAHGMSLAPQSQTQICTKARSLNNGAWSDESLTSALNTITNDGMGLREASRVFGILASSIRNHLYRKTTSRQRGIRPTLRAHEEKKLLIMYSKCKILGTH